MLLSRSIFCFLYEGVISSVEGYRQYNADCYHACYHVTSTIAEKGKRDACNRQKVNAHTYVFYSMEQKHCACTNTEHFAEGVLCAACVDKNAADNEKQKYYNHRRTYKAQFLTDNRKDKVRLLFGQIAHLGLYAVFVACAEKLSRANGYFGLDNVIA